MRELAVSFVAGAVMLSAGISVASAERLPTVDQCAEMRAVSLVMPAECGRVASADGTVTRDGITYTVMPCDDGIVWHFGRGASGC